MSDGPGGSEEAGERNDAVAPTAQEPRPMIERLGLGLIAIVIAVMFGTVGYVSLAGGEVFLGIMGGIGALMTMWAAVNTLRRG